MKRCKFNAFVVKWKTSSAKLVNKLMTVIVWHLFSTWVTVVFSSTILFHLVNNVRLIKAMDILCKVHVNIDLGNLISREHSDKSKMFSHDNRTILRILPILDTSLVYWTPPTTSRLRSSLSTPSGSFMGSCWRDRRNGNWGKGRNNCSRAAVTFTTVQLTQWLC